MFNLFFHVQLSFYERRKGVERIEHFGLTSEENIEKLQAKLKGGH